MSHELFMLKMQVARMGQEQLDLRFDRSQALDALETLHNFAKEHIKTVDPTDREAPPYAATALADSIEKLLARFE